MLSQNYGENLSGSNVGCRYSFLLCHVFRHAGQSCLSFEVVAFIGNLVRVSVLPSFLSVRI